MGKARPHLDPLAGHRLTPSRTLKRGGQTKPGCVKFNLQSIVKFHLPWMAHASSAVIPTESPQQNPNDYPADSPLQATTTQDNGRAMSTLMEVAKAPREARPTCKHSRPGSSMAPGGEKRLRARPVSTHAGHRSKPSHTLMGRQGQVPTRMLELTKGSAPTTLMARAQGFKRIRARPVTSHAGHRP